MEIVRKVDEIYFPENFQGGEISTSGNINFHFGYWEKELTVQFLDELSNDVIGLSGNLRDEVFIPDNLFYEINTTEDSLSLGPVILYLISKRLIKQLDKLKKRFENIASINGLIIISTTSGINTEKNTITGYYLQSNAMESNWKEVVFPYPGAVFKRVGLPQELNQHLYDKTNGRVINSNFFNKWDMWKWLSPQQLIRNHIPHKIELNSLTDIYEMLVDYPSIHLKPENGSQKIHFFTQAYWQVLVLKVMMN